METQLEAPNAAIGFWNSVFNPRSIAVIGKTERPKGGYIFITTLKNAQFRGTVHVVSTDGGGGLGFPVCDSIADLPERMDYAIIAVPARNVPDTVLGLRGKVAVAHVFSSGFGDLGTDEGRKREDDLRSAAAASGVRIIGPNCLGVYNPAVGIAYPPGIFPVQKGNIGFISQSGGTAQSFAWCGENYHYFHSKGVSVGNSADLALEDFLEYMVKDPESEIIAMYVEGVRRGSRYIELIRSASKQKPIVVLKAGRSQAGVTAAASHTGIMAGRAPIWDAAIRQAGGIQVESFDELVETVSAFTKRRGRPGRRIALVNRGGGEGVIAADLLPRWGLDVPEYTEATQRALSELIPSAGTGFKNPLDFAAIGGYPGVFEKVLDIIDSDENTDTIIYQHHIEFAYLFSRKYNDYLVDTLISFYEQSRKTLIVVLPLYYSAEVWLEVFKGLTSRGVSTHPAIFGAMRAAVHLAEFEEIREKGRE